MSYKTVLFQGDSITDAFRSRDTDTNEISQLGGGYVRIIAEQLERDKKNYRVFNRGISGDNAVHLYSRLQPDIIDIKPDILSILIGVNDVWRKFDKKSEEVEIEEYKRVYDELLKKIYEALPNIKIILLEPFVADGVGVKGYYDQFANTLKPYQKTVLELSKKYNTEFIPLQKEFDDAFKVHPVDYLLADGVHPTKEGHELIAKRLLEVLERL